jgi:hypothetical protein
MALKIGYPPVGLFKGVNFMTPNVVAYYELPGGNFAEISEGRGMSNQPIFGVTVRPDSTKGKLFQSMAAALGYVEEMSEE